jgi:excisionase family DNA binding protein
LAAPPDISGLDRQQLTELLGRVLSRLLAPDDNRRVDQPSHSPDIRLLSAKQVAELWNVPETWIRDQARSGKLLSVKRGHYVRFRPSDLERFCEEPDRSLSHGGNNDRRPRLTLRKNGIHRV